MAAYGCLPITCSKPSATFQTESERNFHPPHVTETGTKASTNGVPRDVEAAQADVEAGLEPSSAGAPASASLCSLTCRRRETLG